MAAILCRLRTDLARSTSFDSLRATQVALLYTEPVLVSATIRTRKGERSHLGGALVVKGFVPVGSKFRPTARKVAPIWLGQQTGPVAWIADEGLKDFYEDVLSRVEGEGCQGERRQDGFLGSAVARPLPVPEAVDVVAQTPNRTVGLPAVPPRL